MHSISFVCGSKIYDGIYRSGLLIYDALVSGGFDITWYQCTDGTAAGQFPEGSIVVRGTGLLGSTFSMGYNRLISFPRKMREVKGDLTLLMDPTLLRVEKQDDRRIVKIHDLRPFTEYSDKFATKLMFRYAIPRLKKSRAVIVTTDYLKGLLGERGFDEDRVHVIPETSHVQGGGREHLTESLKRATGDEPLTLLCVSTDRPYKHVELFLRLTGHLLREDRDKFRFILVSKLKKPNLELAASIPGGKLEIIADVEDISAAYQRSDILIFPSSFEGFGIPLVEAMSKGMPVVARSIPVTREIVGDAGRFVEGNDLSIWAEQIHKLSNPSEYTRIAENALKRYMLFDRESYRRNVVSLFSRL